jgi:outer membrane receptor protein involved in Fe transport
MRALVLPFAFGALAPVVAAADALAADVLEEVIVTATLRQQPLIEVPLSISVLSERDLREAGRQHFEDVMAAVPNLHWASGTSRPRFFQIRGIGEREQWEGAPNPSVGFLIDDIDFSGIGMSATLFDMERIEVLRGPQGLRYGANALAGLISMQSRAPEQVFRLAAEASVGDYGTTSLGAVATGPISAWSSAWRLAVQRSRSDGFRESPYLHRDDTNGRDELTARAKWRWTPSEATTVDLLWLHTELDNGYDAWSIDNTRRSLADRPGKDSQFADAGALRITSSLTNGAELTLVATLGEAQGEYSYDEDWGNPQAWAPYVYDYFYRADSERRARSFEARLASAPAGSAGGMAWLAGAYVLDTRYDLRERRVGEFADPDFPEYSGTTDQIKTSRQDALNVALFGQIEGRFAERWGWSLGLRGEQREADYVDRGIDDGEAHGMSASRRERMLGGQASLYIDPTENARVFATLSRGYKAGGFNIGRAAELRERFDPEYLWGLDLGVKSEWLERRLYADLTAFYMKRDDMQVTSGIQEEGIAGSYIFFTDNASNGTNAGIEASVRYRPVQQIELGGALALLRTRYSGYRPLGIDMGNRDQAQAPEYQVSLHAAWRSGNGWMARADFTAVDDHYSEDLNDRRVAAYSLTHLKAGYERDRWSVYVWARNVFDKDYVVHGFYFANEPPNWEDKRYVQLGEPRQVGVSVRWEM